MGLRQSEDRSLLKFVTVGSVDDGKSTLIGRLLVDTGTVFEDQLEAVKRVSAKSGFSGIDYSLLLDGLAAEREQGITIDVAYRYFSTSRRKFVVADCPGHEQYTRNMFTGASIADLAVVLLDAERGIQTQSKRHGYIASMLRMPFLVVVVNKMDLVGYSRDVFEQTCADYRKFAEKLGIQNVQFIPVSAVAGDNITSRSENTDWYEGPSLLECLETADVIKDEDWSETAMRFPVQWVCRPKTAENFRGYSGEVLSGQLSRGDRVQVLPSGQITEVEEIVTYDGPLASAGPGQAVTIVVRDQLDISRGDMIVSPQKPPQVNTRFEALVCWMDEDPLMLSKRYLVKHTTREVTARFTRLVYRLDVNSLHREGAERLSFNELGRVEVELAKPLFCDSFDENRETGSFIVIDPESNRTVGGGLIQADVSESGRKLRPFEQRATNIEYKPWNVTRGMREQLNGHRAAVVWLTGLPSSGKSTIANLVGQKLFRRGHQVYLLDGDKVRSGLCADLGFSREEREENLRRIGQVAKLFYDSGQIVVCSFVSPYQKERDFIRSLIGDESFVEVHVKCSIDVCKARDPKGHYRLAIEGTIPSFTGVSAPYEEPLRPEIVLDTEHREPSELVLKVLSFLEKSKFIP